jgi:S-DNA-T family DNA segregation ATPase FtsK/SpoIIIE
MRKEIKGILFLLAAIVLAVSLFSYSPRDPVLGIRTGQAAVVQNLFGAVGAHLSGWLFLIFGFSSFWLVAVCLSIAYLSFAGVPVLAPLRSGIAALVLMSSFSSLTSFHLPREILFRGGKIPGGGLVGSYVSHALQSQLNDFGAYVLLLAVFVLSLMVCTHFSFGGVASRLSYAWIRVLRAVK